MSLRARWAWLAAIIVALLVIAGVGVVLRWQHGLSSGPPPHATRTITPPAVSSNLTVPVFADLAELQRLLDQEIPLALWRIDRKDVLCVGQQHVRLFGKRLAITPKLHCDITGSARRGPITLRGAGHMIIADVPILAHVDADHIGGLANAHADGSAMAHARITLGVARDWQAAGTITLGYDWTSPPTVTLLGQKVAFTDKADERLKPVIAQLQHKLPAMLAGLDLRRRIAGLWQHGFAVINLNRSNPPVWLRIVPQSLSYGGYTIVGNRMRLQLGLVALTQAVVGARPADPPATALPDMASGARNDGAIQLFVPVIADYAELVPVLARALSKRAARPFILPGLGAFDAQFSNIEVYGASQGRIAVGADIVAVQRGGVLPPVRARIWFAGKPQNARGSQVVHFSNLTVSGATDSVAGKLAVAIAGSAGFSDTIADALTQNFTRDYARLSDKIRHAIADREQGNLRIDAQLDSTQNETLEAYANGLYMPVWLTGRASVTVNPAAGKPGD
jgi:hypothetical protein